MPQRRRFALHRFLRTRLASAADTCDGKRTPLCFPTPPQVLAMTHKQRRGRGYLISKTLSVNYCSGWVREERYFAKRMSAPPRETKSTAGFHTGGAFLMRGQATPKSISTMIRPMGRPSNQSRMGMMDSCCSKRSMLWSQPLRSTASAIGQVPFAVT
jgi:hypothetical protein